MTSNKVFYNEISQLRDLFHKYGRFDDSNSKLDEISKYISIYIYQLQKGVNGKNNFKKLVAAYEKDKSFKLVPVLKELFEEISLSKEFLNDDRTSIFGNSPTLNIEEEDNNFAYHLIKLVVNSIESIKDKEEYDFDLLNESFGHFVRDNFRNHIEDAQYMTPSEAVELMCNIALNDLEKEDKTKRIQDFIVCDPCCGVGSFLSTFYKKSRENNVIDSSKLKIVGQDKVARMVRFAKINMLLFNNHTHLITKGNSLAGESALDNYNGKVDLILTNPPFGAKFSSDELKPNAKNNYPILHDLILSRQGGTNFSSEILFVDRCISLLKPNGKLLAVLPDSVISSAGLSSTLRHRLINTKAINIRGIIELPSVTFAQAGTRTKTSILYLEKVAEADKKNYVFIAQSEQIGFEVSTKKGATVKIESGENDLLKIFESYQNNNFISNGVEQKVLSESPSCVLVKPELLHQKSWTPSHYNARKLTAIKKFKKSGSEIELVKLNEIVDFMTNARKREYIPNDSKCISILHILNDDNLNYEELLTYNPKYQGTVCKAGDLLFSKINPRILRVLVVPDLGLNLTCSSEFEIMNSTIDINNYGIKLLLMIPSVQTQINYLTSGTSSSHNRIKSIDLANVLIPLPKKNTKLYDELFAKAKEYERRNKKFNELRLEMSGLKKEVFELVS